MAVFLGCPSPMILRPTHEGHFKVVGEAYCDEFANGEALLSVLPDNFRVVFRYNERQGRHYTLFLNSETGSFQAEDPRLSQVPLPLGWRKDSHELEEWLERFSNDKEESVSFDPRLTAEALKQRGVDIQTINLI